jgi:succinate dehydrogenase / fumarate reductase cytochrome b subunit
MSERPLSPHLQVYRLPITAILSISHRITGLLLVMGMVFWVIFLMALAEGEAQYAQAQKVLGSVPGRVLLWIWLYALFFHLCHGVRHLIWDTVHGLERDNLSRHAYLEIGASVLLTLAIFLFALLQG